MPRTALGTRSLPRNASRFVVALALLLDEIANSIFLYGLRTLASRLEHDRTTDDLHRRIGH